MAETTKPPGPAFGLVVSTLGRIDALRELFGSLQGQLTGDDELVVVAQGNHAAVAELCSQFPDLPIHLTTSARGASIGRNAGVSALSSRAQILQFPNDTTGYPPGTIDLLRTRLSPAGIRFAGMVVVDANGPKLPLPASGEPLTKATAWQVIEMGLLIARDCYDELGGFDETIGTGAPTPWQSGESADLLLRALARWPELAQEIVWLPTDSYLTGATEAFGLSTAQRRQKIRAYGRGLGYVGRRHRYPLRWCLGRLAGGLAIGLRRPEYRLLDGWWAFIGRAEGLLGRTVGWAPQHAVER